MNNPLLLEACYKRYIRDISRWLPEGIIEVNLELLHKLNLLCFHSKIAFDHHLTRYFHVVETEDKLTLANEDFIVWIVPEKIEAASVTYILIALNRPQEIHLELAFMTRGVYNNSYLVLRLLEKFLMDIQQTEDLITKLEQSIPNI